MEYSHEPHLETLVPQRTELLPSEPGLNICALIDAGQLALTKRRRENLISTAPCVALFDNTFARSAPELSPLLFGLASRPEEAAIQLRSLDAACQHLPVLSVIHTTQPLTEVASHLRNLLRVEADDAAYLLRFADTQMLKAVNGALKPSQRAGVMGPFIAWYVVDHHGRLSNMADAEAYPQAQPPVSLPLVLDTQQTQALLDLVKVPTLSSQVRYLDERFQQLSHAQQTEFIAQCIAAANQVGINEEDELMRLTFERWHAIADTRAA